MRQWGIDWSHFVLSLALMNIRLNQSNLGGVEWVQGLYWGKCSSHFLVYCHRCHKSFPSCLMGPTAALCVSFHLLIHTDKSTSYGHDYAVFPTAYPCAAFTNWSDRFALLRPISHLPYPGLGEAADAVVAANDLSWFSQLQQEMGLFQLYHWTVSRTFSF